MATLSASKNRYHDAPRAPDFTIDQAWETYSAEEHDRWDRLFMRQKQVTQGRACTAALKAMAELELSPSGIPHMGRLSDRLEKITGWRVVPVAELVPDDIFFDHLANRRFPAGASSARKRSSITCRSRTSFTTFSVMCHCWPILCSQTSWRPMARVASAR